MKRIVKILLGLVMLVGVAIIPLARKANDDTPISYEQDPTLADARIEDDIFVWQVVQVHADEECTRVVKSVTPKVEGTYIYSDGNECLVDKGTGNLYFIAESSLPTQDAPLILVTTDTFYFTEIYPALPYASEQLDIYSGNDYYIHNWPVSRKCE